MASVKSAFVFHDAWSFKDSATLSFINLLQQGQNCLPSAEKESVIANTVTPRLLKTLGCLNFEYKADLPRAEGTVLRSPLLLLNNTVVAGGALYCWEAFGTLPVSLKFFTVSVNLVYHLLFLSKRRAGRTRQESERKENATLSHLESLFQWSVWLRQPCAPYHMQKVTGFKLLIVHVQYNV